MKPSPRVRTLRGGLSSPIRIGSAPASRCVPHVAHPQNPLLNNDSPSASGKNFVLPRIDANDLFQIQL